MKTGQPSHTAIRIAANHVGAAREPRLSRLLLHPEEPYAGWFLREFSPLFHFMWTWGPTRRLLYRAYDRRTPGAALYLLLRKRWVEERVRSALDAAPGLRQVALLGAGLDPLPLRLARSYPHLRLFELDHPDTQQFKLAALRKRGALPPQLGVHSLDLSRESLDARLPRLAGYDRAAPTFWLVEGLLMYLDAGEAERILTTLARGSGPGSQALFTFVDADRLADPGSTLARMSRTLEQMGEPIRSSIRRAGLPEWLARHGWELEALADHSTFRAAYLSPGAESPLADGELLALARRIG